MKHWGITIGVCVCVCSQDTKEGANEVFKGEKPSMIIISALIGYVISGHCPLLMTTWLDHLQDDLKKLDLSGLPMMQLSLM